MLEFFDSHSFIVLNGSVNVIYQNGNKETLTPGDCMLQSFNKFSPVQDFESQYALVIIIDEVNFNSILFDFNDIKNCFLTKQEVNTF